MRNVLSNKFKRNLRVIISFVIILTNLLGSSGNIHAITPDWGNPIASRYYSKYPQGSKGGFYNSGNWTFWLSVNANNEIVIEGSDRKS